VGCHRNDSHIGVQAIAALAHPAELQPHAVCFQKRMRVALRIEHADLVVTGAQIAFRAAGQIALAWAAAAEQHRLGQLGHGLGLLAHDPHDHLLDQGIGPEKGFFGAAVKAQWLLEINITGIETIAAAQGCEHGAVVSPLDQVLQGATAPAIGQVGHVKDHGWPWAPDRVGDPMAPMRHEDPLGIDRRHGLRYELGRSGDALQGPIQTPAETIGQGAVPGAAGEQQQGALFARSGGVHQLRIMPRARVMNSSCSSRGAVWSPIRARSASSAELKASPCLKRTI